MSTFLYDIKLSDSMLTNFNLLSLFFFFFSSRLSPALFNSISSCNGWAMLGYVAVIIMSPPPKVIME